MTAKAKAKTGRPLKKVDAEQVDALARIGCTYSEMAAVLNVDKSLLSRRFATRIAKGREHGKSSLRHAMWRAALGGNITSQIWLSKNVLGYSDKAEVKQDQRQIVIMRDEAPTNNDRNGGNGGPHNPEPGDTVPA